MYGLASRVDNDIAAKRIYEIKGRGFASPLPILLDSEVSLAQYCPYVNSLSRKLAQEFWPGALTIVLRKNEEICDSATGGLATAGFRVPASQVTRRICSLAGGAVTGTSANKTGLPSAKSAQEAFSQLKDSSLDLIIDGGSTQSDTASTVIACTDDVVTVLRLGAISVSSLREVLGNDVQFKEGI